MAACVAVGVLVVASNLHHAARIGSAPTDAGADKELVDAAEHPRYVAIEGELQSMGIPVNLAELAATPLPDARNAGPLYVQMTDARQFPGSKPEDDSIRLIDPVSPSGAWAAAQTLISTQPRLIEIANRAGSMPECYISRSLAGDPQSILFPEVAQMGRAARIISVESLLKAHEGQYAEAVGLQGEGFTIAHHAKTDLGLLFGNFVGLQCDETTLAGMEKILRSSGGAPKVAEAVDDTIARNWHPTVPSEALAHEVAVGNSEIRYLETEGPDALANYLPALQPIPRDGLEWTGFIDLNGTTYLDLMERTITAANLPYPSAIRQLSLIDVERAALPKKTSAVADLLYPHAAGYCTSCCEVAAKAAVTRAACAVFLYQSKHGRYPSTLADAAPTAIDPFDGKLVGYRREANGFVVYSVGPTGQYNGGAVDVTKEHEEAFRYP